MHSLDQIGQSGSDVVSLAARRLGFQGEDGWRELLQALPVAVYTTDAEGRLTFYNDAAAELAGYRPEVGKAEWCVTWKLYLPDGTPLSHAECPMALTLKRGEPVLGMEAIAERPDGVRTPFQPCPALLRDASGKVVGGLNMLIDITERKRSEERQKALIDELNHRVKNTLVTVQSIALQTARLAPDLDAFTKAFESRLLSLAKAHDLLARHCWQGVSLHDLLGQELAIHAADDLERVRLEGPLLTLNPRTAVALALVVHELADNAARHGALSIPDGRVVVSWRIDRSGEDARALELDWVESSGPAVSTPQKAGFGTRLVERAVRGDLQGDAELRFEAEGLKCLIRAPLAA